MNKAKAVASSFLAKGSEHDTTAHEAIKPAIQTEHIAHQKHKEAHKVIGREVLEQHAYDLVGTENHELNHSIGDYLGQGLETERTLCGREGGVSTIGDPGVSSTTSVPDGDGATGRSCTTLNDGVTDTRGTTGTKGSTRGEGYCGTTDTYLTSSSLRGDSSTPIKIMILNPWGVDYMDSLAEEVVAPYVHTRTEIVCTSLGADASPMPWPMAESRDLVVNKVIKAQADGFDAVIIGCCADPFLSDARQAVSIPVVGLTESFCMTARSRGKVALLIRGLSDAYLPLIPTQNSWKSGWSARALGYGLQPDDFTVRRVFVPDHPDPETLVDLTKRDQAQLRNLTVTAMGAALHKDGLEQTLAAAEEDGAKAVFFACAFWSQPIQALNQQAKAFRIPVINPLVSAVSYAEHLVLSKGGV